MVHSIVSVLFMGQIGQGLLGRMGVGLGGVGGSVGLIALLLATKFCSTYAQRLPPSARDHVPLRNG